MSSPHKNPPLPSTAGTIRSNINRRWVTGRSSHVVRVKRTSLDPSMCKTFLRSHARLNP